MNNEQWQPRFGPKLIWHRVSNWPIRKFGSFCNKMRSYHSKPIVLFCRALYCHIRTTIVLPLIVECQSEDVSHRIDGLSVEMSLELSADRLAPHRPPRVNTRARRSGNEKHEEHLKFWETVQVENSLKRNLKPKKALVVITLISMKYLKVNLGEWLVESIKFTDVHGDSWR